MDNNLKTRLNFILKNSENTGTLISDVLDCGETLLIGGALREFKENELTKMPRDIDMVVNTDDKSLSETLSVYNPMKNRFGGYKIAFGDLVVDIWCLKNTWAFAEEKVKCSPEEYSSRLQDTVFLNLDAIVYNLSKDVWYDKVYMEAMRTRVIDVVLPDNPQIALNIVRSILLRRKYCMRFSYRLQEIVCNYVRDTHEYLHELMEAQLSHYKCEMMNSNELRNEIAHICNQ